MKERERQRQNLDHESRKKKIVTPFLCVLRSTCWSQNRSVSLCTAGYPWLLWNYSSVCSHGRSSQVGVSDAAVSPSLHPDSNRAQTLMLAGLLQANHRDDDHVEQRSNHRHDANNRSPTMGTTTWSNCLTAAAAATTTMKTTEATLCGA